MSGTPMGMVGWVGLSEALFAAGDEALAALRQRRKRRRRGSYATIRPGPWTPMWNRLRLEVHAELKPHGAKVRLARYLGIPKQRLSDFIAGHRRMPDAELTLRILHWLAAKRDGTDLSI